MKRLVYKTFSGLQDLQDFKDSGGEGIQIPAAGPWKNPAGPTRIEPVPFPLYQE